MSDMEQPDAASLLEIARETLQREVIPQLLGDARFKALMVANAMAIARRAAAQPPVPDLADAPALVAAIRAGAHDDDAALAARLRAHAEARCRISAPKAL
jgi:hypothetical protein